MCWSIPGKIVEMDGNIGTVDISGVKKKVPMDLIDAPSIGEYVLIHAGYAIQKVDEDKAKFTLDFFDKKGKSA